MTDTTAIIRTHVQAVTEMLLASRKMKDGVAIVGGAPLGLEGRIGVGSMAKEAATDIVHLEFAQAGDREFKMTGINLFAVRDNICHIQTQCQLWQPKSGARALILPRALVRGQFRLSPRELIHTDGKPCDIDEGIKRADVRLNYLVKRNIFDSQQATVSVLSDVIRPSR